MLKGEFVEDVWLPEHRLMPIGFVGSSHVLSSQSAADHRVIMVLHTPAAQPDVIKTCSIPCLEHKRRGTLIIMSKLRFRTSTVPMKTEPFISFVL